MPTSSSSRPATRRARRSVAATREAGITVGGGSALDGLVRSLHRGRRAIGDGEPLALAPDDFHATERLIRTGFSTARPKDESIGAALRAGAASPDGRGGNIASLLLGRFRDRRRRRVNPLLKAN
jgi:hypothetical protein